MSVQLFYLFFLLFLTCCNTVKSPHSIPTNLTNTSINDIQSIEKYDLSLSYPSVILKVQEYKGTYIFNIIKKILPIDNFSSTFNYTYETELPNGITLDKYTGNFSIEDIYSISSMDLQVKIKISKNEKILTNMSTSFSLKIDKDGYKPLIKKISPNEIEIYIPKLSVENTLTVYQSREEDLKTVDKIKAATKLTELKISDSEKHLKLNGNFQNGLNYIYLLYTYNDGESYMIKKIIPFQLDHFFAFSKINFNNKTSTLVFNKTTPTGNYTYKIYEFNEQSFSDLNNNFSLKNTPLASSTKNNIDITYKDCHHYLVISSNHSTSENIILSKVYSLDQFNIAATNISKNSAEITFFPFYTGNKNEFVYKIYSHTSKPTTLAEAKAGTLLGNAEKISAISLTGLNQFSINHVSAVISNKNINEEYFTTYSFVTGADLYWDAKVGVFATNQNRWVNLSSKGSINDGVIGNDGSDFNYNFLNKNFSNSEDNKNITFQDINHINAIFIVGNFSAANSVFIGHKTLEQWKINTGNQFFANDVDSKIGTGKFWKNEVKFSDKTFFTRDENILSYGILLNNEGNLQTGIKASQVTDRSQGTTVWKGKFQKMIIFTDRPTEVQMQSVAEFLRDER